MSFTYHNYVLRRVPVVYNRHLGWVNLHPSSAPRAHCTGTETHGSSSRCTSESSRCGADVYYIYCAK